MTADEVTAALRIELESYIHLNDRIPMTEAGQQVVVAKVQEVLDKVCPIQHFVVYTVPVDDTDPIAMHEAAERRRLGVAEPIYVVMQEVQSERP